MPTKLSVFQGAALILGERKPASLSENTATRRRLDTAWDNEGVKRCLKRGLWNHAIRAIRLDYSPSVEPEFGLSRAFDKPTDWVRTAIVASDEYFRNAIIRYSDENGFWTADYDFIYVKYVSDDTLFGLDLSLWPENFTAFVECSLARAVAKATTGSSVDADDLERREKRLLIQARSTDSMDEPTQFTRSLWAESRISRRNLENG